MSSLRQDRIGTRIGTALLLGAGYFFAAKLAFHPAAIHPSPIWPLTGIAIASLLLLGHGMWPAVFLGAFVACLTTFGTVWTSLGQATGNTLEALAGAYLIRRYAGGRQAFDRPVDFFRFAGSAAAASALGATIGVTSLSLAGVTPWPILRPIWLTWWLGDAAGALVVVPLLVLWCNNPTLSWSARALTERVLLLAAAGTMGWIVFGGVFPFAYLTVPFLVWAGFRLDPREVAVLIALLAAAAIWGTAGGRGPFVGAASSQSPLVLQVFLGTMALLVYSLATVVAERKRLHEATEREADRANRLKDVALETLNAILSSAVASTDLSTLLESTVDLTLRALGCQMGGIWAGTAHVVRGMPSAAGPVILRVAQSEGRTLVKLEAVDDWRGVSGPRSPALSSTMEEYGIRASVAAPIQTEGRAIGGVAIVSPTPRTWLPEERLLVEAIGKQIGGAVERLQLFQVTQRRKRELEAFYTLSRLLREAPGVDEMYPMIVEHAMQLLASEHGALSLLNPDGNTFTRVHTVGIPEERSGSTFPAAGTRSGQVVRTGVTVVTNDVSRESFPASLDMSQYRALGPLAVVPLRSEDDVIGTLCLARVVTSEDRSFIDVEVRLLEGIAEIAGTAIRRGLLHDRLEQSYIEMVLALARAADARDSYTADHSDRIATRAVVVARALGCAEADVQDIHWGALLHDIGKLGVPDSILRKPGPLTEPEWEVMRRHPAIGEEILRPVERMQEVATLVRHHQERWDGRGYPDGLIGEAIPLGARILAVADAYGAITDDRAYAESRTKDEALAEIRRCAGSQFDPRVVEVFCRVVEEGKADGHVPGDRKALPGSPALRPTGAVISRSLSYARRAGRVIPAMADVAKRLLRPLDLTAVLDGILSEIQGMFGYPMCGVLFIDEQTRELYVKAQRGYDPGVTQAIRFRVGEQGIAGWVASHGRPYYAPDVTRDPLYVVGSPHVRSYVGYPLTVDDRVIGVLDVASPAVDAFPQETRELLEGFAVLAALAILRAQRDQDLRQLALTDGLTGLPNHRALWDGLEREVARAARTGQPVSLAIVEIDGFKRINDRMGHLRGDAILRSVGNVLRRNSRSMDLPARFGGDEFAVLLCDVTPSVAAQVAERVRHHVEAIPVAEGVRLTVSVGLASMPADGSTARELMEAADQAMYEAKGAGGNRVNVA